ncbi:MAG TPA: hypothetical protein PLO37_21115 [Candidatus Hydrogenedentes bacterium]|nr:hypothetical protein [Candidatus Hydrogenedentota bacterium]HPG69355.1 hypothetical protein [Candidatus Hydrogenedentota bacterium]
MSHGPIHLALASAAALGLVALSVSARAVELWMDNEGHRSLSLDPAVKVSGLGTYAPDDPWLYPERSSALGLFRLRLGFEADLGARTNAELAYEHRARWTSSAGGTSLSSGVLSSFAEAPYRIRQLDWELFEGGTRFDYRHEIDRALVAWHPKWGDVTLGRQAIGLGRGVIFSAVDMFSPFSPAEVDREWRRGVDALRLEYRTSDTSAVEFLGVFGETWDDSAVLGRVRGYLGDVDGEFILGKRAEDVMAAGILSAILADAETHLELALFHLDEPQVENDAFGGTELVGKIVAGGSYTFAVGNGLTLLGEYHYSGFGFEDSEDATWRMRDADVLERFLRGDSQILGRHGLAAQLSYSFTPMIAGGLLLLGSPADGSGLVSPSVNWDISQRTSLRFSAFVPWGQAPRWGQLRSEYGATPASLFAQLNVYF